MADVVLSAEEHFEALRDAGNNAGQTPVLNVQTDNTAPSAPSGLTGAPLGWQSTADFNLAWQLPGGQAAPITGATVRLCAPDGACATQAAQTVTTAEVTLSSPGVTTGGIVLVDAAGNSDASNEASFTLRYDPNPPPAPQLGSPTKVSPTVYSLPVTITDPGPAPLTRLESQVCPAAGGTCEPLVSHQPGTTSLLVQVPGPGEWRVDVRAVDAADNAGALASATFSVAPEPTPTPTPTVTTTPSPTATPTATTTPTTTATTTPSATPTASPTATPRLLAEITITRAVLRRARVRVAGTIASAATGRLTVTARTRDRKRTRSVPVTFGSWRAVVPLSKRQRGARRVRLRIRYWGDSRFLPATLRRSVSQG